MKLIRNVSRPPQALKDPVLTIGIFDGVHLAHQKVIRKVVSQAKALQGTSVVLTFAVHPEKTFRKKRTPFLVTSLHHRLNLISQFGVDVCLVLEFNRQFSRIPPEEFVRRILVNSLKVKYLIVGEGFRFGKNRKGDFSVLKRLSQKYKFYVRQIKTVKINDQVVSSTKIRRLIQNGKMSEAKTLLGRDFSIYGRVKKGKARGRILGYPTANIEPEQEIIPASGVYAVFVKLKNKFFSGITNVGRRPTFAERPEGCSTIEVHIFNFHKQIYGQSIEVFFIQRLRAEKKFISPNALLNQIKKDEHKAKAVLKTSIIP